MSQSPILGPGRVRSERWQEMSESPHLGPKKEGQKAKEGEKKGAKRKGKFGDEFCKVFEIKLKRAKQLGYISNAIYGLTWFLGFCALTWASAVILGGLLTGLARHDYYSTMVLLLLESVRLATTTFFGKVVTLKLVHGSADPQRLRYDNVAAQNRAGLIRILEQAVQLTVLVISIIVPIRRLLDLQVPVPGVTSGQFDATKTSLRIFYVLVLVNASIATAAVMYSMHLVPFILDCHPLRKYYGKIVWMGMDAGLLHARDFDFLAWTFEVQADEYRSNQRALVVKQLYKDLLLYLYYHPKHKGFEVAKVALDSSDAYQREAAANIVGLWVSLLDEVEQSESKRGSEENRNFDSKGAAAEAEAEAEAKVKAKAKALDQKKTELSRLSMQTKLLAKLADALDNTETGRGASLSFLSLAASDAMSVLKVQSEGKNENLADIFMDEINMLVEMGRPKNALTYIKAIIPLLPYLIQSSKQHNSTVTVAESNDENRIGKYCTASKLARLKQDMWTIVSNDGSGLKRLQVVAAYAYDLLPNEDEECKNKEEECKDKEKERKEKEQKLREYLRKKPKSNDTHMLNDEANYLLKLLKEDHLPREWENLVKIRDTDQRDVSKPVPLLARPSTTFIASLVTFGIIGISSTFITKYGNF